MTHAKQRAWRTLPRWASNRTTPRRRGAAVVLIVVLLMLFLAAAALSVDVAYMHLVNRQLGNSTDAAAMAAVEVLGRNQSATVARSAAKHVALSNLVSGQGVILTDEDIVLGRGRFHIDGSVIFAAGQTPFNAARVTGRKEHTAPSGAAPLFFASLLGYNQWDTRRVATAARWERDICLVVDRSFSMAFDNKLPDLRAAVSIFLDVLDADPYIDNVALVSYNQTPRLERNLTSNLSLIHQSMLFMTADGQTNIGGGISTGRSALLGIYSRPTTEKTMILLTDGIHNIGLDPIYAATQAAASGIVIHTITFGADADQQLMQRVAEISGGTTYHAPDGQSLREIYRRIALTFGTVLTE
jgi:Ca-activated chloride channel homolog